MCRLLTTFHVIAASSAKVGRYLREVSEYLQVADCDVELERMKLSGVQLSPRSAPEVCFELRDLDVQKHSSNPPLLLTTAKAKALFGKRYENVDEGLVDFPSFEAVREDVKSKTYAVTSLNYMKCD